MAANWRPISGYHGDATKHLPMDDDATCNLDNDEDSEDAGE